MAAVAVLGVVAGCTSDATSTDAAETITPTTTTVPGSPAPTTTTPGAPGGVTPSEVTTSPEGPGEDGAGPEDPGTSSEPLPGAEVTISYAGWVAEQAEVQVNAFVDVVEDGGSCTLELVDPTGSDTRSVTVAAVADATTTVCEQLAVPGADLAAGTWTATVTYTSVGHQGRSAATDVEVSR